MFDIDPHDLIARADALLAALADDETVSLPAARNAHVDAAEAYRFAAALLGARGRPEDLPLLAQLHAQVERSARFPRSVRDAFEVTLAALVGASSPTLPVIEALAHSDDADQRRLIAAHLPIDTALGRDRVAALLVDPSGEVRAAARQRLPDAAPPWWSAAFSRDPLPFLASGDAAALEPALRAIVDGIDRAADDPAPLYPAFAALPTPLLFDAVQRIFAAGPEQVTWERPLLPLLLERPGGLAALRACLAAVEWPWTLRAPDRQPWLLPGSPERRAELALALADELLTVDEDETDDPVSALLAELLAPEWPVEIDPAPLIERALARPQAAYRNLLMSCLSGNAHVAVWAARMLEERLAGGGPLEALLDWFGPAIVEAAPASVVRPFAERALGVPSCFGWAVKELLGRCHEPERDPPVAELAQAWLADPRMATAVRDARGDLVREWLRARLASGQATLKDAVVLLEHDPGPLDDAAWAQIRRLRNEALAADPDRHSLPIVRSLKPERWGDDEWAAVDTIMERVPTATFFLEELLCAQTSRETLPRVERALLLLSSGRRQRRLLDHRVRLGKLHRLHLGPPVVRSEEDDDV